MIEMLKTLCETSMGADLMFSLSSLPHLATLCPHDGDCPSLSVRLISKVGTVLGS